MAKTPSEFEAQLEESLKLLKTDYIDIYQFHCATQVYKPNDGTGMYECMLKAKQEGKIRHIGITAHQLQIALDAVQTGLYETLQFPFSYLSSDKELQLVQACQKQNMGFIAMKGLAGGLINQSKPAMAFMAQFDHVLPIWGIQKESELDEWLAFNQETPTLTSEIQAFIEKEKKELSLNSHSGVIPFIQFRNTQLLFAICMPLAISVRSFTYILIKCSIKRLTICKANHCTDFLYILVSITFVSQ